MAANVITMNIGIPFNLTFVSSHGTNQNKQLEQFGKREIDGRD